MAKKSMAKKKSHKGATLMLVALGGLIFWAWHAYGAKLNADDSGGYPDLEISAAPSRESRNGGSSLNDDLMWVRIPSSLTSELIEYPGFTVSFNAATHQPNYVAWELTGEEVGSQRTSRRSASFAPDPAVAGCATLDDYRRSGYDRGHMAPAGDMKWDSTPMQSSFLLTNISPQAHELNQGSWRALEEKCRDWAVRDSAIVIVCGPIFGSSPVQTIGETAVAVPDSYFKVVLAPYTKPPRAIGFVMPNGNVPGGMQACAMSVDEVEAVTGMDFFSSLPDEIEDQVEAECNFPRWSRKKIK